MNHEHPTKHSDWYWQLSYPFSHNTECRHHTENLTEQIGPPAGLDTLTPEDYQGVYVNGAMHIASGSYEEGDPTLEPDTQKQSRKILDPIDYSFDSF